MLRHGWDLHWVLRMLLITAQDHAPGDRSTCAADAVQALKAMGCFPEDEIQKAVAPLLSDAAWLPSHSDVYRSAYQPAYRIVAREFVRLFPILDAMAAQSKERLLLTIDGPCGSGKTTMADLLSRLLPAPVIHMDDFYVPIAQKTAERLSIPGGNANIERLMEECLLPWQRDGQTSYRPYLCHEDRFLEPRIIAKSHVTILEGSYSNMPPVRAMADVRVYLTIDEPTQLARIEQRNGPERLKLFISRWIPLEQAYHRAYGLPDDGCLIVSGSDTCEK